jgi:hypothetical protein
LAHLDELGLPTASKFANDVSRTSPGTARVVVHHTAAAGAVDIDVRRPYADEAEIFVEDFAPGAQAAVELRPGNWSATIFPAGIDEAVLGPATLKLRPYRAYFIYAVGSVEADTFTLIANEIFTTRMNGGKGKNSYPEFGTVGFGKGRNAKMSAAR